MERVKTWSSCEDNNTYTLEIVNGIKDSFTLGI